MKEKIAIQDKNAFILDASKIALHALLSQAGTHNKDPNGLANLAHAYAVALYRRMRIEAQ